MKIKKMADGGPTYPLYGNQRIQNNTAPSMAQKFVPPAPMMPTPGRNLIGNPMLNQGMNQPIPQGMKKGGRVGMKEGGMTEQERQDIEDAKSRAKEDKATSTKKGMGEGKFDPVKKLKDLFGTKKAKGGTVKMAKGGSASSRADGIAQRGKTKGRLV
jgi:hypothetical protein